MCGQVRHPFLSSETLEESGTWQTMPSSAVLVLGRELAPSRLYFLIPKSPDPEDEVGLLTVPKSWLVPPTAHGAGDSTRPLALAPSFPFHWPSRESLSPGPGGLPGVTNCKAGGGGVDEEAGKGEWLVLGRGGLFFPHLHPSPYFFEIPRSKPRLTVDLAAHFSKYSWPP